MKKVNFKVVLVALSFAFSFLFLGMNSAAAQSSITAASNSTGTGVYALPTGSFQSNQAALNTLMTKMLEIKGILAQMPNESDPTYIQLAKQVRYYTEIHAQLTAGVTVPLSIVKGLYVFPDAEGVPANELQALKNGAVALLD